MRPYKQYVFVTFFLSTFYLQGANIIFDLGGVLIGTNHAAAFRQFGLKKLCRYICCGCNPLKLQQRFLAFLDEIDQQRSTSFITNDPHGRPLPQCMCDWLQGTRTNHDIRNELIATIQSSPHLFYNRTEQNLMQLIVTTIFTPEILASTRILIQDGITFVQECIEDGHQVYIISNWESESFQLIQKNHAEFFNLFDGIVISGKVQLLKPDPAIFNYFLTTYNLDPHECIMIDDQPENVAAAQSIGIHGIVCPKNNSWWKATPDFAFVRQQVQECLKTCGDETTDAYTTA